MQKKKEKTLIKISMIICLMILLVTTIYSGLQSIILKHEITYATINKNFGIETEEISVNFLKGNIRYEIPEGFKDEDLKILKSLHSINELVTYQFVNFYLLLFFIISAILFLVIIK